MLYTVICARGKGRMKPDCLPEIKGRAAREFEARVKQGPSAQQKKFLQEACVAYKKVK